MVEITIDGDKAVFEVEGWDKLFLHKKSKIPPTAVGGLFRSFLLRRQLGVCVQIPPTEVGGWFRSFLLRSGHANARAR
jgi:hypothetical protein